MAGCAAQRFEGVGVAVFACLQAKGAAAGLPIAGNEGKVTARGITMRWNYEAATEVLVIECLDVPMLMPCSMVTRQIQNLVDGCRPAAG